MLEDDGTQPYGHVTRIYLPSSHRLASFMANIYGKLYVTSPPFTSWNSYEVCWILSECACLGEVSITA